MSEFIYWDPSYNTVLFINFAIAIGLFTSLRLFSGVISHINASKELLKKDNPAFGISLAGAVIAVAIVLVGAIYGDPVYTLQESIVAVGLYGVLGIILLAVARIVFDRMALPKISIRDQIVEGNIAAAIVDAGNMIATAIIIRAVMIWVAANTFEGITAVMMGFVISQCLLTAATYIRVKCLKFAEEGNSIQKEVESGNVALALRFTGRRIGTAFAITAALNIMVYELHDTKLLLVVWAFIAIMMMFILSFLSFIATKVILAKVNVNDEVIRQRNVALGAVQCAIYAALGLLLSQLVS